MSMDNEFNRFFNAIRNLIRKECHRPNDMIYGKIVSVDPLKIDIGGNIILEKEKLFLGQMCRPHKVTIPHTHQIDGMATDESKAITKSAIGTGAGSSKPETLNYTTATQQEDYDSSTGKTTRTKEPKTNNVASKGAFVGATYVSASGTFVVSVSGGTGPAAPAVGVNGDVIKGSLTDTSVLNTHLHTIKEHETRDVHFAGSDYEESVTIEIEPKLHVNDIVLMFAFNNNQMYYVAERIEE